MANTEFKDYVLQELMSDIPGIVCRAMFGGFGFYKDDIFFSMIANDVLYFKVDDINKSKYTESDSKPFVYVSPKGKEMVMSYYEVPENVMDNQEMFKEWVNDAVEAGIRAKKK